MAERRSDDIVIAKLSQQLADFLERYERDIHSMQGWRDSIDERFRPLEDLAKRLDTPLKIVGLIILSGFGAVGLFVYDFIRKHWNS